MFLPRASYLILIKSYELRVKAVMITVRSALSPLPTSTPAPTTHTSGATTSLAPAIKIAYDTGKANAGPSPEYSYRRQQG